MKLQKGKNIGMSKLGVNIIEYANFQEILKSYLIVKAKIIASADVVSNVC